MKKYGFFLLIIISLYAVLIAQDRDTVLPGSLPGMQNTSRDSSAGEVIFSQEELSDIMNETQGGAEYTAETVQESEVIEGDKKEKAGEEDVDTKKIAQEIIERILNGLDEEPREMPEIKRVKENKPKKTISEPTKKVQERKEPVQDLKPKQKIELITPVPVKPALAVITSAVPEHAEENDIDVFEAEPLDDELEEDIIDDHKEVKTVVPVSTAEVVQVNKTPRSLSPSSITIPKKPIIKKTSAGAPPGYRYFEEGVELYARRELRKAAHAFEAALDQNENDMETYYMLADVYYQLYDVERAWNNIKMAVSLNGNRVNPLYKAIEREVKGTHGLPINIIMMFLAGISMLFAGTVYFQNRRRDWGPLAKEEIQQLKKEIEILKMKNDIQDPRVRYYKALEACENGSTMLALNNFRGAEEEFRTAIMLYPQIINAYLGLGYIHFMEKKYDAAATDYSRAIDIDPSSPTAYYGLGRSLGEKGDALSQLEKIQMAAQLDPGFKEASETLHVLKSSSTEYHSTAA